MIPGAYRAAERLFILHFPQPWIIAQNCLFVK